MLTPLAAWHLLLPAVLLIGCSGTRPAGLGARDAWSRLAGIITSLPRSKVMTDSGTYLNVEFTSFVFRFVDEVKFLADDAVKVLHVRFASCVSYSDLGANRRRIEISRARWQKSALANQLPC